MLNLLLILPFIVMMTGCSLVVSQHIPIKMLQEKVVGSYYYLPKGKIHIQALRGKVKDGDKSTYKYSLNYINTIYAPDEEYLLLLHYKRSVLSDDVLKVSLTKNGLLQKIESTTEDKSGAIIIKLVDIAKEVAKTVLFPMSVGENPEIILDVEFGLSEKEKMNTVLNKLSEGHLKVNIEADSSDKADSSDFRTNPSGESIDNNSDGICFRTPRPYRLIFYIDDIEVERHTVFLPDGSPKLCTPITRAAFVRKVTNLTFDSGVLTEIHIEKPSEALAFMEIPLTIAKAILSVPAELIQLKINYSSKDKELHDARKAELEAKQALLDYIKKQREKDSTNDPL